MARATGPDESVRTVYLYDGPHAGKALAQGVSVPLYSDTAGTVSANVQTLAGVAISGSPPTVSVDAYSQIPEILYPDGVKIIYTRTTPGGPVIPLPANGHARLTALESSYVYLNGTGIDKTGVTDSTAAMQAIITAAPAGSTIIAGPGIYKFSSLVVANGKTLAGTGWNWWRDAVNGFGTANWNVPTYFNGTIFRSTATTGIAIQVVSSVNTGGAVRDFLLIGPGSGTSTGIDAGASVLPGALLDAHWVNVKVCNFNTGIILRWAEECRFDGIGARGCNNGVQLVDNTNNNVFHLLDVQACTTGLTDDEVCIANTFVGFIGQGNFGTSAVISGVSEIFEGGYFENNLSLTGLAVDVTATANGTVFEGMQFTKITDGINVRANAHNTRIIIPTFATQDTPLTNAGIATYLCGDFATTVVVTDTGTKTIFANTGTGRFSAELIRAGTNTFNGSAFELNGAAGTSRQLIYYSAGVVRWSARAGGQAESGSNAGTNWELVSFSDAGATLSTTSVRRSDGFLTLADGVSERVCYLRNTTEPVTPSLSGVLFVIDGALKYKGSAGTVTTIAPA